MVWQRNDDQYGVSRKVTRIPRAKRLAAVGLDQLAKNYSVRALTDGVLDDVELEEVLATRPLISELVKVGLWHESGHDCDRCVQPPVGGVVIHDFLEYNPDASSVAAARADKSEGGKHGNHIRWHEKRGVADPSCEWCATGYRSHMRIRSESDSESHIDPPGPVPGPVPLQTDHGDSQSHVLGSDASASEDELILSGFSDLRVSSASARGRVLVAVRGALPFGAVSDAEVVDVAREILTLSTDHVRYPAAYIEKACREKPETVRGIWERSPKPPRQADAA